MRFGAFRVTPVLLLALGGGVAADALDRRKLMLGSQIAMMLASVGLFAATFLAGSLLLLPIFADQLLHVGPRGLGGLYAAQPVGAAVRGAAPLGAAHRAQAGARPAHRCRRVWRGHRRLRHLRLVSLSLLALAISGAADTVSMVMRQTLRQILTPDELRGRMTSVNMMFFIGGPQLGEVEAGVVAKLAGVRFSVWLGGALCVLAAVIAAVLVPSLRKYEHQVRA